MALCEQREAIGQGSWDGTTTNKSSSILVDENVTGVTGGNAASYYLKKIAQFGQWDKVGMESWEMAGM